MSFIKNCFRSIYDGNSFKELEKETWIRTILYFLVISLTLGMVVVASLKIEFKSTVDVVKNHESEIPNFKITDKKLDLENDNTVIIKESDMVLIFDEKSDSNEEYTKANNAIFWGSTGRKIKRDGVETSVAKYADVKDIKIDRDYVLKEAETFSNYPITALPQIVIIGLLITFMTSLLIKMLYGRVKEGLTFGKIYKLGLYSSVIPMIAYTIIYVSKVINVSIVSWAIVIIQFLYVNKAVKTIYGPLPKSKPVAKKKQK